MVIIYSIEGSIGSGKSTIVNHLKNTVDKYKKNYPNFCSDNPIIFLDEPVSVWETIKNKNDETILSKFYKDQDKYAFSFQMMAYISRISMLRNTIKKHPNSIIVCERSVFTDCNVFAKMLYDTNKIEEINYLIYLKWFNEFIEDTPIHRFIYINASPNNCDERIIKRNRKGETVPLEYSKLCVKYHDEWLSKENNKFIIDANKDIEQDTNLLDKWINEIHIYIESTLPQ